MSEGKSSSSAELCGEGDGVCIGSGRSTQNIIQENDKVLHRSPPLKVDRYDGSQLRPPANAQDLIPIAVSFTCLFLSFILAWFLLRQMKRQREWLQASKLQLKQISQRNMSPKNTEQTENKASAIQADSTSKSSCRSPQLDKQKVRAIRQHQQKQNEIKTKLVKQQKRNAEEEKKRIFYKSLQHQAANQAQERRRKLMCEEQSLLLKNTSYEPQSMAAQTNESEDMERRELLHQQDLEYEESLRRDQDRSTQTAIETERCRKRLETIHHAIHRLISAGIYTNDLPVIEQKKTTVKVCDDEKIQVRLLLPDGKRIQATYSKYHSIGLIYDMALVILNYNLAEACLPPTSQRTGPLSRQRSNDEWKDLFDLFTIKTAFPPQSFDDLELTLEQCGFQQSVMLMVMLESN